MNGGSLLFYHHHHIIEKYRYRYLNIKREKIKSWNQYRFFFSSANVCNLKRKRIVDRNMCIIAISMEGGREEDLK